MGRPPAWQLRAFAAGAGFALLAALATLLPATWSFQEGVDLHWLFVTRGARPPPDGVLIVPIDARAAASLYLPAAPGDYERCADVQLAARAGYRNPDPPELLSRWPRCLHARVLEALAGGEPDAVVMDISFRPRSDPSGIYEAQDRVLAAAMRRAGKVVLVRRLSAEDHAFAGAQPLARELEAAAAAVAPFLLLGDRLQRADKFCAFLELGEWSGACLPTAAHQVVSAGRLARLALGDATRYFNFYGPPGTFRSLRYEALAAGGAAAGPAPGSLRGKVVFIGFAEYGRPEAVEHFGTPFTTAASVKLSGVELAATAFANLHDGSAVRPAPAWARALAPLSLGLLCTLLCVALPPGAAVPLCAGCVLAYLGGAAAAFERHALWLPLLLPVGVAVPLAMGSGLIARYREMKRERDRGVRWAAMLLPPALVQRVLGEDAGLDRLNEPMLGACLNTDIEKWTTFAASQPLELVSATLRDYFARLASVAYARGADWDDKAGDAMMALWLQRHAGGGALREAVCRAALELAAVAERFSAERPSRDLRTRIGVHYGPIVMSLLGAPPHLEYRAIGDPPNAAQRLQQLNKTLGTRLLVSAQVLEGVPGLVHRELGRFRLRGRAGFIEVHELVGEAGAVAPERLELLAAFADALRTYRSGRREAAGLMFARLAALGDRPSGYYAALCRRRFALRR